MTVPTYFLRRIGAVLSVLTLAFLLGACAIESLPQQEAPAKVTGPGEGYRLEPGNRVRVIVFGEEKLSGDFTVDPSGNLAIPLAGSVVAAGATGKELARRIEALLQHGNFLNKPQVSVEVQTFRPYYVLGEVRTPGEFPYTAGVTVLGAIARAGGYDYRARKGDIVLVRELDGRTLQYRAVEETPLLPGDIVKVLERAF